jgi:hypothetical protein
MRQYGEEGSYGKNGYGSFDDSYGSMRQYGKREDLLNINDSDNVYGSFDGKREDLLNINDSDNVYGSFDGKREDLLNINDSDNIYGSFDDSYGSMRQTRKVGSYGNNGYGSFDDSYEFMKQYGGN